MYLVIEGMKLPTETGRDTRGEAVGIGIEEGT